MTQDHPGDAAVMRTLRFHQYGAAADVLRLEEAAIPVPGPGHIRVRVRACGLNPADWALCNGLFPGALPRGVGLDVSGTVDALGEGVDDVKVGDLVFGVPDFQGYPSAGAADYAVLSVWRPVPEGLDLVEAATLPMVIETAYRCIDLLEVTAGQTILVYGAGTMVGFGAVQMALMRGAKVIAAAGDTFAGQLEALGAVVTPYGQGMVERVRDLCDGAPDLIFDARAILDVLPDLVAIAGGDAHRVLTVNPVPGVPGVRNSLAAQRYDRLAPFAQLAAEGRFKVPIAQAYGLDDWRAALDASASGHAHGKIMLLPAGAGD